MLPLLFGVEPFDDSEAEDVLAPSFALSLFFGASLFLEAVEPERLSVL